ncbi:flavin reductase family protein [Nitrospina sp. 32_T5]|uniref:flavin reductase family protein n=1 Tax=unclassified Nitrospina TaxID=2638683 RepID=UPI003F95DA09
MRNKKQIGKALGRVPSGLFIVTASHEDREDAVLTSWVNQCSFEPPAVTIVLGTTRPARLLVEASGAFTLNILGKESNSLLKHFFKPPAEGVSIFQGLNVSKGHKGIKILDDSVAYLECEVREQQRFGDHILYTGEVVGGKTLKGGEPYVHVRDTGFSY